MKIEVGRKELEALVRGSFIPMALMDKEPFKSNGSWTGGFVDEWHWNIDDKTTDAELIKMYNMCKEYMEK